MIFMLVIFLFFAGATYWKAGSLRPPKSILGKVENESSTENPVKYMDIDPEESWDDSSPNFRTLEDNQVLLTWS